MLLIGFKMGFFFQILNIASFLFLLYTTPTPTSIFFLIRTAFLKRKVIITCFMLIQFTTEISQA